METNIPVYLSTHRNTKNDAIDSYSRRGFGFFTMICIRFHKIGARYGRNNNIRIHQFGTSNLEFIVVFCRFILRLPTNQNYFNDEIQWISFMITM